MNPSKRANGPQEQLIRAKLIRGTFGTRAAAKYLRSRGWSIEAAMLHLVGPAACERINYMYITGA